MKVAKDGVDEVLLLLLDPLQGVSGDSEGGRWALGAEPVADDLRQSRAGRAEKG